MVYLTGRAIDRLTRMLAHVPLFPPQLHFAWGVFADRPRVCFVTDQAGDRLAAAAVAVHREIHPPPYGNGPLLE